MEGPPADVRAQNHGPTHHPLDACGRLGAMKHAPRGRIKARHPMSGVDPMSQRCAATSKVKHQPCGRMAIPGGTVCRYHGGAAPQVIKAAEGRLEALRTPAVAYLAYLLGQREYPSAGLGAAKDVLDRVDGKAAELIRVIESTEHDLATLKEAQRKNAEQAAKRRSKRR